MSSSFMRRAYAHVRVESMGAHPLRIGPAKRQDFGGAAGRERDRIGRRVTFAECERERRRKRVAGAVRIARHAHWNGRIRMDLAVDEVLAASRAVRPHDEIRLRYEIAA